MSKFGVLVMGPAGAGKTTFCAAMIQHLRLNKRSCFYVNLDPAADEFTYEPDLDIKDLIALDDVMTELHLGPNGGLIYCFEFLLSNLDFLTTALDPLSEEYLIILDMPGQIELYTHIPILPALVRHLTRAGSLHLNLAAAYLMESSFVVDRAKYFAGTLSAMSAMVLLEVPHLNVLSKMDLLKESVTAEGMSRRELKRFLDPDTTLLDDDPAEPSEPPDHSTPSGGDADVTAPANLMRGTSFKALNRAVAQLIDDFGMVSFLQLDVQDEDSVGAIVSYIDDAIQYHEAQEPREPVEYGDGDMDLE